MKESRDTETSEQTGLELDEVINPLKLPWAAETNNVSISESSFKYVGWKAVRHRISCKLPKMFELCHCEDDFKKILALTVIFETLNIAESSPNNKHVVLHFKENDKIPTNTFELLAKHCRKQSYLEVNDKITGTHAEFKDDTLSKYVFVCNFRKFSGLEHSNVTVVIDSGIAALQHYHCINKYDRGVKKKTGNQSVGKTLGNQN